MHSLIPLLFLLLIIFIWLIYPVKKIPICFDEKGEAIKVYKEELGHLNRQQAKGFIDAEEKKLLLIELDKKSALAISAIEHKNFTYQHSYIPLILIIISLLAASGAYYYYYQKSGIRQWHDFQYEHKDIINKGLFDTAAVKAFVNQADNETTVNYCFALQKELLNKYDTNPDALANLAQCHLLSGYPKLAIEAAKRGLDSKPQHIESNYILAEIDFVMNQRLAAKSVDRLISIIKINPNHFDAMRLLAINSLGQQDYQQARFFVNELKRLSENDPQLFAALQQMELDIRRALSTSTSTIQKQTPKTKEVAANTIMLSVKINPKIAQNLTSPKLLFVVLKTEQGQVINASKHTINDVNRPLQLTINDNQTGAMKRQSMKGHKQIMVTARISNTGQPIASKGDLTSAAQVVKMPAEKVIDLIIDRTIP